jgi:carboxyl-terminal processing protease
MDDGKATPDDVAGKLRGPEGSKVGMVIQRKDQTLDFILRREPITITSVKSYLSEGKIDGGSVGVIKIKNFSGTTASLVADAINDLKKKGATAFVLDLRGNPGGLLPGGVATASLFLDSNKPVVFVVDKNGVVDSQSTLDRGMDLDSSLVIFTNGNTASAAEVMTAALKENGRATVVGDASSQTTFGKGIIQTIRQLSYDNGGVAVTVARYETPLHHDINKQGIPVDFSISECPSGDDAASCIPKGAFQKPIS